VFHLNRLHSRRTGNDLRDHDDPLIHLGILKVGVPYSIDGMIHTEARGGTPYGATTISGPKGELPSTAEDLAICRVQGKRVADLAKKIRS
jgi:NAD(P)H dehydrogenase (quinone)